jgi:hypothetical protein
MRWQLDEKSPRIPSSGPVKAFARRSGLTRRAVSWVLCWFLAAGWVLLGCREETSERKWSPHYRKAVAAYQEGDFTGALALFEKALLYEPSHSELYLDIGAIYEDFLGDPQKAVSCYEKFLEQQAEGEKAEWVKGLIRVAKARPAVQASRSPETEPAGDTGDPDQLVETLRGKLADSEQALAEEKMKSGNLATQLTALGTRLSASQEKERQLQERLATYVTVAPETVAAERRGLISSRRTQAERRWLTVGWLLCSSLFILVVALIVKQRYAAAKERELIAGIQASAEGSNQRLREDDILGKYFWVENDHSAGVLSFTKKDDEICVCAIDGTTRLRSRGKGRLLGNVLSAELRDAGGEGVPTKFIFANGGRTLTAIWAGEEGSTIAAGTKDVHG